jgi:chitin disaccharide deacetylase
VREEFVSDRPSTSGDELGAGGSRWLVVNADDLGATSGINDGIVEAHEHGIVTSASLMVRGEAAASAGEYARAHPELGLGLHVELRDWRVRRRPWSRVRTEEALRAAVAADVGEQLEEFRRLVGRDPTHLDSHHHRHRIESLRPIFLAVATELDVPLRHVSSGIRFCGEFYGQDSGGRPQPQAITPGALVALLERLPAGISELGSHPGYPEGLRAWYREERVQEIRTLCDPDVRDAVERLDVSLVTFGDVRRLLER